MSTEISDIEQTLRKLLNIETQEPTRDSAFKSRNEHTRHRENLESDKNIRENQLIDLERNLKHVPSGPPSIAPFSKQKSYRKNETITKSFNQHGYDNVPTKNQSDSSKHHTFDNRDFSKVGQASQNVKVPDTNNLLISSEEWPALRLTSPQDDQIIKPASNTKAKRNKNRTKKKSKTINNSLISGKPCELTQQITHHKRKFPENKDPVCPRADKPIEHHYVTSADEVQQTSSNRGVIYKRQTQPNGPNRTIIKLTTDKAVENGNADSGVVANSAAERSCTTDQPTEYVSCNINHCAQAIPSCPKKASKLLEQYNLLLFDKSLKSSPPDEIMSVLREQHILPLKKKSSRHPNARYFCHLCEYHCDNLSVCKKHISSVGHISFKEAEELDITLRQLPTPTEDQVDSINVLLMSLVKEVGLMDSDVAIRRDIVKELNKNLLDHLPEGCKLILYGSSESGVGLKGSLVDIDLFVPSDANINPAQALVCAHDGILRNSLVYENVKTDWGAEWPVIYFEHKTTLLHCVLGLNCSDACKTSRLIRNYVQLDRRAHILCTLFRYWAKECGIDKQKEGTLSPHAFDLMVIYYLQQLDIPILPVLHGMSKTDLYLEAEQAAKCWKTKNEQSVGYLWVELFRYYSLIYPSSGLVISIREGSPVTVTKRNWRGQKLAIEDPFLFKRNLARSVSSRKVYNFVLSCFKLTFKYFAVPQTLNGPLFDVIPRPVSEIIGCESEVGSPSKNCSFDSSIGLEADEQTAQKSYTKRRLEDFTEYMKCEQKLENVLTESKLKLEKDGIFSNHNESDSIIGANNTCPQMQKEEETCTHVEGEQSKSLRTPDIIDSSDSANEAVSSDEYDGENINVINTPKVSSDLNLENHDEGSERSTLAKADISKKQKSKCCLLLPTPPKIKELINGMRRDDFTYTFKWHLLTGGKKPIIECSTCQKEGHLKHNCPEDQLPELRPLPPPNRIFIDAITRACFRIEANFKPSVYELQNRRSIINELSEFISNTYPDAHLELFGSSCNGFGFKGSDLDICLTFKKNEKGEGLNIVEIITTLAEKLKKCKSFHQVIAIATAKVPIVRFTHRNTRLECDISLYNALAQHNTRMLHLYSQIDRRVHVLAYTMKYFTKLCGIGDASKGSLSSYAYNLMVLYFLQRTQPPIIPVLQELYDRTLESSPKILVDGWNAWYFNDLNRLDEVWSYGGQNRESVGDLWLGLLRFYTEVFDFKKHVISIRQLKPLTRFEKLWNSKCIAIEDPFELSHNLGMGVSRKMNTFIMKTFIYGRSVFGHSISALPPGYRTIEEFLFDPRFLTDGPPPNDRCCRVCGCIGHIARDCPRRRGANSRLNRENEKKSRHLNDVSVNVVRQAKSAPPESMKQSPTNISKMENAPQIHSQSHQWRHQSSRNSKQNCPPGTPLKVVLPSPIPVATNRSIPENPSMLLYPYIQRNNNGALSKSSKEEDVNHSNSPVPSAQGDALVDKMMPTGDVDKTASDVHIPTVMNNCHTSFSNVPSPSFSPTLSPFLLPNHDDKTSKTSVSFGQQNIHNPFGLGSDLKRPLNASAAHVAHVSGITRQVYSSTSLPSSSRRSVHQLPESELALQGRWPVQNVPPPFVVSSSPQANSQCFSSLSDARSNSKVYMSRSANLIGGLGVTRPLVPALAQPVYFRPTRPYKMDQNVVRSFPAPNMVSSALPQALIGLEKTLQSPLLPTPRHNDTSPSRQQNWLIADKPQGVPASSLPPLAR